MDNTYDYDKIAEIEKRLHGTLFKLCDCLGIPVSFHKELQDRDGACLLYSGRDEDGNYGLQYARIKVLKKYKKRIDYIAHELGHYMAIKKYNDTSEEAANNEAMKLCKSLLAEDELVHMQPLLNFYFLSGYDKYGFTDKDFDEESALAFVRLLLKRGVMDWMGFILLYYPSDQVEEELNKSNEGA